MTPFILKCRTKLPSEDRPSDDCIYDQHEQIWIEITTGNPVVMRSGRCVKASQFGETSLTESHEGVDQPDVATLRASSFGETTHTAAIEGVDEPHMAILRASQFGETTITKAPEGTDQANVITELAVNRASYSHF